MPHSPEPTGRHRAEIPRNLEINSLTSTHLPPTSQATLAANRDPVPPVLTMPARPLAVSTSSRALRTPERAPAAGHATGTCRKPLTAAAATRISWSHPGPCANLHLRTPVLPVCVPRCAVPMPGRAVRTADRECAQWAAAERCGRPCAVVAKTRFLQHIMRHVCGTVVVQCPQNMQRCT